MQEKKHRDYSISLTCGMIGIDFENGYDFSDLTTIELENILDKSLDFNKAVLNELKKRPDSEEA